MRTKKEVQASEGGSAQGGRCRSRSQRGGTSESAGRKSGPQAWPGRPTLEEIVDVSSAQARLSADEAWSKADTAASLRHLQKATEGGLSVESLGVHVLRAVSTRASPLGDLTREVLRTSFTTVNTLESPVRQRDLLPLPFPWSWAPFAEVLLHAVDERHPRGLRSEDRRRHDLHGVGCWSLLTICILNFLYAGVGHLHESRVCRYKKRGRLNSLPSGGLWVMRSG